MYNVLIASVAGFIDSTEEISFIYNKAGCRVDVYCNKKSWLLSNKFHDNLIDSGDDSDESYFSKTLISLVSKNPNHNNSNDR